MRRVTKNFNYTLYNSPQMNILIYSPIKKSLEDYSETFSQANIKYETVNNPSDAKKLLLKGDFQILMADVTNFEASGRRLIAWAKKHIQQKGFRTYGFTRTDLPGIEKKIYSRGVDERFYYDHLDIDHLTELLFELFIDHPDLSWVVDMTKGQKALREKIEKKTACEAPVLLLGAKGLGKESLAQIAHGLGNRGENNFIVLDCNPRQKFDYVFKHGRDNESNRERLRQNFKMLMGEAYGGTLFFRSFTHLSTMAQSVLEEVLKDGKCTIFKDKEEKDVTYEGRIIFASNKCLPELVEAKKLNPALYRRLMKNTMRMKPIAEFGDDVIPLAEAIIANLCLKCRGKIMELSTDAKSAIIRHPWAGNLDEMRGALESAVASAENLTVTAKDLPFIPIVITDMRKAIEEALLKHGGNKSRSALEVGVSRGHFYKLLREYGLDAKSDSEQEEVSV